MSRVLTNVTVNPACNGWIIFVTPKFIEGVGDRAYVAETKEELERIVGCLSVNLDPEREYAYLEWPGVEGRQHDQ